MKKLSIILLIIISCSEKQEIENLINSDEIIAIDTMVDAPNFSERFGSAGKEDLIWQFNKDIVPENYIEQIDDTQLKVNGISILDIESLKENLDLEIDERLSSNNVLTLSSTDKTIMVIIQNNGLSSIILKDGVSIELSQKKLFDLTFETYKKKFPHSYNMRNFTTSASDIFDYQEIDSIKTLDFTELFTKSGKLKLTWANGRVEKMEYLFLKW